MHYYTHNIGEFAAQTRFLTPEEIGIYVILKDEYFANGMRLACERIANVMPPQCEASLKRVLQRFFREENGFFVCDAFEKELDSYKGKGEKNRENAKKRWEKKRIECESNANLCDSHEVAYEVDANLCLTNNHKPLTNNHIKENKKKSDLVKPEGVEEELFDEWLGFKKSVTKAKTSQRMVDAMVREAAKAGISTSQAMVTQMENGWQGFKAEYVNKRNGTASFAFDPATVDYSKGLIDNGDGTYSF